MDLLAEYEFESLPYIDNEYDNPEVKAVVHSLISDEMKTFSPANYLAHLSYPNLQFSNSSALAQEYDRIIKTGTKSSERIDSQRYIVKGPSGPLQKDVQAWRKAVSNAKSQYEHEQNKLLNLEIASESIKPQWLAYNSQLEIQNNFLQEQIRGTKRKVSEINVVRRVAQEKTSYELNRYVKRRNNAIIKQNQILLACNDILENLPDDQREQFTKMSMEMLSIEDDVNGNTDDELY